MRRSGEEEEREGVEEGEHEDERKRMCPEIKWQLLLGLLCLYFSLLFSCPADGRYEQDEKHHRTGTIQSLQRQGEDFIE